jgi:acetyl-CoA carboxylase carboxyltransferase component
MSFEEMLEDLARRREKALKMGKPEILKRMKEAGQLNARERLGYLLDEGSFVESGLLATAARPEVRDKAPADGKIAGFGKIAGRWVGVVSNDFSVMGASSALVNL